MFGVETGTGAVFLLLLCGIPGWIWLRTLGMRSLLLAPIAGVCIYSPLALFVASLLGFHAWVLLPVWVIVCTAGWRLRAGEEDRVNARLLFLGAALLAAVAAADVYPVYKKGGLYVAPAIYDHAKVALVDSMAREGLPPRNPYFSDNGAAIPINYYYGAHFLAAHPRLLLGISGWPADVAMTWFTALAMFGLTAALGLHFGGPRAGRVALLLCFAGSPSMLFSVVFGSGAQRWVTQPGDRAMGPLMNQVSWAYQHVLAAAALLFAVWVGLRFLERKTRALPGTLLVTGAFAAAAASSAWLAVTFALVSPLLIWAVRERRFLRLALPAAAGAAVLCAPVFVAQLSGDSPHGALLGLHILPASELSSRAWLQIPLFWLHYLPLEFGVAYVLGLAALRRADAPTLFRRLSLAMIVGSLLVAQFVKSAIYNNDLGWRCVLLAWPLLQVWCGIAVAQGRWQALWYIGLTIALLAGFRATQFPDPRRDAGNLPRHRLFARQELAWEIARRYAGPSDIVQGNPEAFSDLTPWPINPGWALFADRPTAIGDVHSSFTLSWRRDPEQMHATLQAVRRVFGQATPTPAQVRTLRDRLRIKVIVITQADPVWPGKALAPAYRSVHRDRDFAVFLANW